VGDVVAGVVVGDVVSPVAVGSASPSDVAAGTAGKMRVPQGPRRPERPVLDFSFF